MEFKLLPGITQEAYDAAVQQYGEKVKQYSLPLDDENSEFLNVLTREPDLATIGQYQQWDGKNWKKANEILIRGVIIGKEVADKICNDTGLFLGAIDVAVDRIPKRKGVKNS